MARRVPPSLNIAPTTPSTIQGEAATTALTSGPNTPTLSPIPMSDISGSLDELTIGQSEDFGNQTRSGQQSPKPRGRKSLGDKKTPTQSGTTPTTVRRLPDANTPGTQLGVDTSARKLTPINSDPQNSPSRGQRSPLRRHLVRANNSFNADTDLVATPPPSGARGQSLDKIMQNTNVDTSLAGRRAYRLATQLPTNKEDESPTTRTPGTVKKKPEAKNLGQQRVMAKKPTLTPSTPTGAVAVNTSPSHAGRQIISPEEPKMAPLTVVLDLDETLVHSIFHNGDNSYRQIEARQKQVRHDKVQSFNLRLADGDAVTVNKRPKLAAFLKSMETEFHAQVFTAALSCYAEPVLNKLDPKRTVFKRRLYREGCTPTGTGAFAKDLTLHFKDLSRVVLVDNNPLSLMRQPDNGLLVPSFFDDPNDDVLPTVLDFLRQLAKEKDIRPVIRKMRENSA